MASPSIVLSKEAEDELLAIGLYIAERDGRGRADMVIARIRNSLRTLATMPGIGTARSYLEPGVRSFAIRPWIVIYEPLEAGDGIYINRILDGRRDLPSALRR